MFHDDGPYAGISGLFFAFSAGQELSTRLQSKFQSLICQAFAFFASSLGYSYKRE
jgi:hypothetical protein